MARKKEQSTSRNKFLVYKQARSPNYSVRIQYKGQRRAFSTGTPNKKDAETKARAIMADIQSQGWDRAIELHSKRRDKIPANPSVEAFTELYREVSKSFDRTPRPATLTRYIAELKRVCKTVRVSKIGSLTPEKVDDFKKRYLQSARADKREEASSKRTLNGILRNAASLFSKSALAAYKSRGINLQNPFEGKNIKGTSIESYKPLNPQVLDKLWEHSEKLKDGYSTEEENPGEEFESPNRDCYAILLLELSLGLRRTEADRAEWSWISADENESNFITIQETEYFIPKSKQSRRIPLQKELYDTLHSLKHDGRFIVPSPADDTLNKVNVREKGYYYYRCDKAHRRLIKWLHWIGIEDPNPCHELRKQFGANVSTKFSIYYAQRYLGHSTPSVTSDYYAELTEHADLDSFKPTAK